MKQKRRLPHKKRLEAKELTEIALNNKLQFESLRQYDHAEVMNRYYYIQQKAKYPLANCPQGG